MINVADGMDRGRALFQKHPDLVTQMVTGNSERYYNCRTYAGFKNRCLLNDMMIDNVFRNQASFISDVAPPVIRKAYLEYKAIFGKFLEQDPLLYVKSNNQVPVEQRNAIQSVISDNLATTCFRDKALFWLIENAISYGTYAAYSFATMDYKAGSLITIQDTEGAGDYRQIIGPKVPAVVTIAIHPLNVFVDPRMNYMVAPQFMGFIGDISITNLMLLKNNDLYIQQNLEKAIKSAKTGFVDPFYHAGANNDAKDYSKGHTSIRYQWLKLPVAGNEDDNNWYYAESIGGEVIRIEVHDLDDDVIPLSLGSVIPRRYTWVGNTPLEHKIGIQNMMNWLINTQFESTARLMDRLVIYREGGLDVTAINNRHKTGGYVPYRGQEQDLSKLLFSPQFSSTAFRDVDWLVRTLNQYDQETSPLPNLQNGYNEGGPNNKTLGGAQMIAGIGEMLTSDMVGRFSLGLAEIGKHHLTLLKEILPDMIPMPDGSQIPKQVLLGSHSFYVKLSNLYNYARDVNDSSNRINTIMNWRATQVPEAQGFNMQQFFREWSRASLQKENVNDYYNYQPAAQMPGQMPQQGAPVAAPQVPMTPQPQGGVL